MTVGACLSEPPAGTAATRKVAECGRETLDFSPRFDHKRAAAAAFVPPARVGA
jgi:hypothetical protein